MAVDFGRDVSCGPGGLRSGRLVSGTLLVAEAAYRRLITPRGSLRGGKDEDEYGEDLTAFVGNVGSTAAAAALPGIIRIELLKDERILAVDASVVVTTTTAGAVAYDVSISCDTAAGPFTLRLAVSDVTVELLGYQEAAA